MEIVEEQDINDADCLADAQESDGIERERRRRIDARGPLWALALNGWLPLDMNDAAGCPRARRERS